jgi:pimeloyl-ACP methyl ester carboxylesterase
LELYAEAAGEGPGIVLVHEGICDSGMWDPQWETFARSHRVLRLDLRGFGQTPLEAGTFSNARDVLDTLERHGFDRFALVGVSLGGRVCLEVAVARPDLLTALVVVAPGLPGHDWSQELQNAWGEEEAALEAGDLDEAVEVNLRTWVDGPQRSPDEVDAFVRARVGEMQRRALELQVPVGDDADEELLVPDLPERLGEIRAPTLVVVGDQDQPDMQAIADRLEREIPGARGARIAGVAHVPSMEKPQEFDDLVLGFLEEVT